MFARLYNVAWSRTGRDRPVLPMATIKTQLDAAGAATSAARTDFRYIKRGVLQLPGVASDQDYRANYLIYSNDDSHYFGAWIDSIEWASAGSFAVTFTDDLFTTFAAGATVKGYRTRKSGTPAVWSEAPGDFAVCETAIANVWGVSLATDGSDPILVYINKADANTPAFYRPRGVVATPFIPVILRNDVEKARFTEFINSSFWSSDLIIAAYVIPAFLTSGISTYGTVTFGQYSFAAIPDSGIASTTIDLFSVLTGDDRILLNSHDSRYQIRLGKTTIDVPFEAVQSGTVTIEVALTPSPVISFRPDWNTSDAAKSPKYAFSDFPQISFSENTFNQWAMKNALPAIGSVAGGAMMGGPAGAIAGAIGAGISFATQSANPAMMTATTGATSSIDAVAGCSAAVQLVIPKDKTRAVDYYKRFGYPCAHAETMALTSTPSFTFFQSVDNVITGEMPAAAKDEIDAALKAGVRCWNTIGIGDYT